MLFVTIQLAPSGEKISCQESDFYHLVLEEDE